VREKSSNKNKSKSKINNKWAATIWRQGCRQDSRSGDRRYDFRRPVRNAGQDGAPGFVGEPRMGSDKSNRRSSAASARADFAQDDTSF